jgi:hypothetical protein
MQLCIKVYIEEYYIITHLSAILVWSQNRLYDAFLALIINYKVNRKNIFLMRKVLLDIC